MKPLSIKRRRIYLTFFIILFALLIPLLILYATGYRLSDTYTLTRTGGMYVSVPLSGANAFIDNIITRETRLFQRNIFVQNLKPGLHSFRVEKEGYQPWAKELMVFPKSVTEAHSFLLPKEPILVRIPVLLEGDINQVIATSTASATSSIIAEPLQNPEYEKITTLFATSTTSNIKRKLLVTEIQGGLRVSWTGSVDSTPYYFCVSDVCQKEILIQPKSNLISYDFYPGRDDLIILNLDNGLYVTEIDNRSTQNMQTIVHEGILDFRIDNGVIYIMKESGLYYFSL